MPHLVVSVLRHKASFSRQAPRSSYVRFAPASPQTLTMVSALGLHRESTSRPIGRLVRVSIVIQAPSLKLRGRHPEHTANLHKMLPVTFCKRPPTLLLVRAIISSTAVPSPPRPEQIGLFLFLRRTSLSHSGNIVRNGSRGPSSNCA